MKQSTVIFGSLLFVFLIYITIRGQLPRYIDLFKPKAAQNENAGEKETAPSWMDFFNSPALSIYNSLPTLPNLSGMGK